MVAGMTRRIGLSDDALGRSSLEAHRRNQHQRLMGVLALIDLPPDPPPPVPSNDTLHIAVHTCLIILLIAMIVLMAMFIAAMSIIQPGIGITSDEFAQFMTINSVVMNARAEFVNETRSWYEGVSAALQRLSADVGHICLLSDANPVCSLNNTFSL